MITHCTHVNFLVLMLRSSCVAYDQWEEIKGRIPQTSLYYFFFFYNLLGIYNEVKIKSFKNISHGQQNWISQNKGPLFHMLLGMRGV